MLAEIKEFYADEDEKTVEILVDIIIRLMTVELTSVGERVMFYLWLLTGGDPDNMTLVPQEEL